MIPDTPTQFDSQSAARVADVTRFVEENKARISSLGKTSVAPRSRGEFLAIIKVEGPEAEEDFTDKRHWVEAVKDDNLEDDDADAETEVVERADDDIRARYVTASNLADVDDEHYAPEGAGVHVHWEVDPGGNKRYWFILGLAGAILVGGGFNAAGSQRCANVAAWDGRGWTVFPSVTGGQGWNVRDACVYQGQLYICGNNIEVNSPSLAQFVSIARWNGTEWEALGATDTPADFANIATFYTLAVYDGLLICGGDRGEPGDQIAAYDGTNWSSIGGPDDFRVKFLLEYEGDLWATGFFTSVDAGPAEGLAHYDGAAWTVPADGLLKIDPLPGAGEGECLAVWDDGAGESLYIGGDFDEAGGIDALNVVQYRSGDWLPLGPELAPGIPGSGRVQAICGHENAEGAFLYAGGASVIGNPLLRFEDGAWRPVGSILYAAAGFTDIAGLCEYADELILAGAFDAEFQVLFGQGASRVVRSNLPDTEDFAELGIGLNAGCFTLCIYDGSVCAGGAFSIARQTDGTEIEALRLARFDGPTLLWDNVAAISDKVRALVEFDSYLILGGDFTTAGGLAAAHLARWDGAALTTFGGVNGPIYALYVTIGGDLVIGGEFTLHDGAPAVNANAIIKWDGAATWTAFGDGFAALEGNAKVNAIIEYAGDLYACGKFKFANLAADVVNNIARWDGVEWVALDTGLPGECLCMAVYGGELYVGGAFADYVKKWNGTVWSDVGTGGPFGTNFTRPCNALHVWGGNLYAAGSSPAGNYGRLFRFDGTTWSSLDAGFAGRILTITNGDGGDGNGDRLYVGGDFNRAGDTDTDASGAANRVMRFTVDGIRTLGGGVGVVPNIFLGIDGGAGHNCRTLTYDRGEGDEELLFVVGRFNVASDITAESIGKMGKRKWKALGIGNRGDFANFFRQVRAICRHNDGDGRAIITGGAFSRAVNVDELGGITAVDAFCVAKFRDGEWSGGMDLDYLVTDLCEHPAVSNVEATIDSPNTITAPAGTFSANLEGSTVTITGSAGTNDGDYVIETVVDDETAEIVGAWPDAGVLPDDVTITIRRPHLYAAGWFSIPDRVGKWDGTAWQPLGDLRAEIGADFTCECCISFEDYWWVGTGQGQVWVWDGIDWTNRTTGMAASQVLRFILADLGSGTKLYAGVTASSSSDPCVLEWNGAAWVGIGANTGTSNGLAFLKANADNPTRLVSFGGMSIGGPIFNVTVWDGASWTSLGDVGAADITNDVFGFGSNRILICGTLSEVEGVLITGIGEWRDPDWQTPGAGGTNGPTLRFKK